MSLTNKSIPALVSKPLYLSSILNLFNNSLAGTDKENNSLLSFSFASEGAVSLLLNTSGL